MSELVWTTRDGDRIPVRELTDRHLFNIIQWLWKQYQMNDEAIALGYSMLGYIQGDMAQYQVESDITHLEQLQAVITFWQGVMDKEVHQRTKKDGNQNSGY